MSDKRVSEMTEAEIQQLADAAGPAETADLANQILQTYRDRRAAEEAQRPIRYHDIDPIEHTIVDALRRYDELTQRDLSARSRMTLQERGEYDPGRHAMLDAEPLSISEHLELLANGEVLARYYRHPAAVDAAVKAGAPWPRAALRNRRPGRGSFAFSPRRGPELAGWAHRQKPVRSKILLSNTSHLCEECHGRGVPCHP